MLDEAAFPMKAKSAQFETPWRPSTGIRATVDQYFISLTDYLTTVAHAIVISRL